MEIKECKSSNIISEEIVLKLQDIAEELRIKSKKEYRIYHYPFLDNVRYLAEVTEGETIFFGFVIHTYKDISTVYFNNRVLRVVISDPEIYSYIKEEFTKFAEINKDSIKGVCFEKDF